LERIKELEENQKKLNYRDLYKAEGQRLENRKPQSSIHEHKYSISNEKSFNNSNFKEYNDEGYNTLEKQNDECVCDEENEDVYKKSNLESKYGENRSYSNDYDHSFPKPK
jgi:hypothetical protein